MLRYGGVPTDEQEVVIRLEAQDGHAHVSSTWPTWSRKFEKLHGTPPKYQEQAGFVTMAFWTLPLAAVSVRKGKMQLSEEERARRKAARFSRPTPSSNGVPGKIPPTPYPTASDVVSRAKVAVR